MKGAAGTLADRIKRGPLPVEEALQIGKSICEALEAAHEQGVVPSGSQTGKREDHAGWQGEGVDECNAHTTLEGIPEHHLSDAHESGLIDGLTEIRITDGIRIQKRLHVDAVKE